MADSTDSSIFYIFKIPGLQESILFTMVSAVFEEEQLLALLTSAITGEKESS